MYMTRFAALSAHAKLALGAAALAALGFPAAMAIAQDPAPAKPAALTAEQLTKARKLFNDNSCSGCHTLADADAGGGIGPSLDGDSKLDHDSIVQRIKTGSGPMPGFDGQIPDPDINLLASYILQVKK
jgi:mono/diheme cytochrome c family protein